ncbi:MAG: flagellin [Planctomycetaceae bacterium]|nr:MAG: flagellin [Planctomycetaceae bacterium]
MYLSPAAPARIPLGLAMNRLQQAVLTGQVQLQQLQQQITTGKKFTYPSEAPAAALGALVLQQLQSRTEIFQQQRQAQQIRLRDTDQALGQVADALVQARSLLHSGLGDQLSASERQALADQVHGLLQGVLQAANAQSQGRYLFAGSQTLQAPFIVTTQGYVLYRGDRYVPQAWSDHDLLLQLGIDGAAGLKGTTAPNSVDLNPALTWNTRLSQLHGGSGLIPGLIEIHLDDGSQHLSKQINLSNAETLDDVRQIIQQAFVAEPLTLSVTLDPGHPMGLTLVPSAGTVEVREVMNGRTARELGLLSPPASLIQGGDLDPTLSWETPLSALQGGGGIGDVLGKGLLITLGDRQIPVSLEGLVTLQDLVNRLQATVPELLVELPPQARHLIVSSRLSGADFSIGENGGDNASRLGLRTLVITTRLEELNHGSGVPTGNGVPLLITRRDGQQVAVDLSGAATIQDVLDRINAIDPGHLIARLKTIGNGLELLDDSGAGPLRVTANEVSTALGLVGEETSGPSGILVGQDVNPQMAGGAFDLLLRLETALRFDDRQTLNRLSEQIENEANRMSQLRGDIGARQQLLDRVEEQNSEALITLKERLSELTDTDLVEAVTTFIQQQQMFQALLQISSQAVRLTLVDYL